MKHERFIAYVENVRDCDALLLTKAINRGVKRGQGEALDYKKIMALVLRCAAVAIFCVAISLEPIKTPLANFSSVNSIMTQADSEALYGYINSIACAIKPYLGGN